MRTVVAATRSAAVVALQFTFVLAGSVLVETVFSYPGIGWFIVESIGMRDFPVVQGRGRGGQHDPGLRAGDAQRGCTM